MLDLNQIYLGDCFEVMKKIDDKSIDIIITDPPYSLNKRSTTKNKWDEEIDLNLLWQHYKRIIKDNGIIIIFAQGLFAARVIISNEDWYKYDLIWKKGERISGFLDAKKKPLRNHEGIYCFHAKQPTYNPQFTEGKPLHSKGKSYLNKQGKNNNYGKYDSSIPETRNGSTQKYPKSILNFDRPHPPVFPTEKPVSLLSYLLNTYSNAGDLCLDSFAGSGSTGLACHNTKRNYILIEKDEYNFELASNRLKKNAKKNVFSVET